MNLNDLISPDEGLQQDEWSLTAPTFGEEGQLIVVGWSGKTYSYNLEKIIEIYERNGGIKTK